MYEPNVIIEASNWPETWSYTLSLAKLTELPILYLKKKFPSVIKSRLMNYDNAHEFSTIDECIDLIDSKTQDYFFTMQSKTQFNHFYDSLFSSEFNYCKNVIIVTSKIKVSKTKFTYCDKRSIYSSDERLNQTLDTFKSIKKNFKASHKIIFIDNSEFTDDEKRIIRSEIDIALFKDNIDDIDYYTNDSVFKAYGEVSQVNEVIKYLLKSKLIFKNLFKISGRYYLNEQFVYESFDNSNTIFKPAFEVMNLNTHVKNYFYTSFYKISYNDFIAYERVIHKLLNDRTIIEDPASYGLEVDLPKLFKMNSEIHTISTLGLTQNISVWNKEQYLEQYRI